MTNLRSKTKAIFSTIFTVNPVYIYIFKLFFVVSAYVLYAFRNIYAKKFTVSEQDLPSLLNVGIFLHEIIFLLLILILIVVCFFLFF